MHDIIIIGAGPAGVSAALTAKNRGKSVLIISNPASTSDIYKTKHVGNYPGMPDVSGAEMMEIFRKQLDTAGLEVITARALNAMAFGDNFIVSIGQDNYECRSIILAPGLAKAKAFAGEQEFLGRGVSYCATCDGMLFRGKTVAVIAQNEYAEEEADFLKSIGCIVEYFDKTRARKFEITGENVVTTLIADGVEYLVSGVFILRNTIAPSNFISGLDSRDGHIAVDEHMQSSVKGVFAAGDCTGRPYQIPRAVGQGNIAVLSACEYLDKK